MADKSFGVDQLDILGTGTPTISAPNQLNLDAHTVAISTSVTVGEGMSAVNISATGISTIAQPANSNPMANWTITNNSASAYRFTGPGQSGSDDNPDLYLVRGHRYIFKHNATGSHPIQIRVSNGGSAYTDGVTYSNTGNNTTTDGNNLIINLQHDAPARLFYQCTAHGGMVGNIYTVGGPQVISGVVTATSFVGDGSALTNLPASTSDKIEEGNTKAEVSDTGTNGRFFVETEGTEKFSIASTGDFIFNQCNDSVFNANGNLTLDYKTNNGLRLRQQVTSSAINNILFNVPWIIWNGSDATNISIHRADKIQVGTGVSIGVNGNVVATGIVTATTFVGNLTGNVTGTASANAVLTGSTNNQLVTVTGANAITGESGLTFDGSNFNFSRQDAGDARMYIYGGEGGDARLLLGADEGDDHIDTYEFRSQASDNALVLYQFESGAYRNRMEFETGGNIGINRTNPSSLLHIQGNDTSTYNISSAVTNGVLTISSDAGGGVGKCVGLQFNGPCSNGEGFITMVGISNSEMDMHFGMRSGGNRGDKVIFASNGRVRMPGVYSTNGSNMRDVQIESDGTLCAGNTSVRASKTNITSQTDISWLYDLNPVTFNYRKKIVDKVTGIPTYLDEGVEETSYGLIAEEVETVKKDFCFYNKDENNDDELSGVYYNQLITPLLKAIQDQKKEIDTLKAKVAALEGS